MFSLLGKIQAAEGLQEQRDVQTSDCKDSSHAARFSLDLDYPSLVALTVGYRYERSQVYKVSDILQ